VGFVMLSCQRGRALTPTSCARVQLPGPHQLIATHPSTHPPIRPSIRTPIRAQQMLGAVIKEVWAPKVGLKVSPVQPARSMCISCGVLRFRLAGMH